MLLAARSINGLMKTPFQNTIIQTVGLIITSGKYYFFLLNQTLSILQPVSNCSLMELMGKVFSQNIVKIKSDKIDCQYKRENVKKNSISIIYQG